MEWMTLYHNIIAHTFNILHVLAYYFFIHNLKSYYKNVIFSTELSNKIFSSKDPLFYHKQFTTWFNTYFIKYLYLYNNVLNTYTYIGTYIYINITKPNNYFQNGV